MTVAVGLVVVGAGDATTTGALHADVEVPPAFTARIWKLNVDPAAKPVIFIDAAETEVDLQTRPVLSATSTREIAAPLALGAAQLTVAPPATVDDTSGALDDITGAPYGVYGPDCVLFGYEERSPRGVMFT